MKKTLVNLLSLLALSSLFTLTSCQKEQMGNGTQFRATMEGCTAKDGKTALNGNSLNWVEGDQIVVYGDAGCGLYTATPQTPATVAVFNNVSGETGDAPFRAYYPSTLTTDGVNITLPATQTYVEGSINKFPMYAESANNQLSFRNLCGVLKLHLTKANTNISAITITTNTEANGTYNIDYNNGAPALTLVGNGTNTTTLECTTAQSITNGKDFYIYLPATVDSVKSIMLTTDNGMICTKTVKASSHIGIDRNTITDVTLGENDLVFRPIGSKGGLFTINANGDQVWFSQGNLQYQASTDTWRFAENQYDIVGSDNNNISSAYNGWIDLFGWGTSGYNHGAIAYQPWSTSTTYTNYHAYGNSTYSLSDQSGQADWGYNAISNGGNQENLWYTMTRNEWYYMIYTRLTSSGIRYAKATVNNISGVILLPDNWNSTYHALNNTNNSSAAFSSNNIDAMTWRNDFESHGAVFLPTAGRRWGTNADDMNCCFYWSSTPYGQSSAIGIFFSSSWISIDYYTGRNVGHSVRLVRTN